MNNNDFDTNLYETPPDFFDRCHREFRYDIDLAAMPETAKRPKFFTKADSTLSKTIKNKTGWLNPPYNDPSCTLEAWVGWSSRMCHVYNNTITMLLPVSTGTAYWHNIILPEAAEIRFIQGRLWFLADGVQKKQTRHDSVLVVFRPGCRGAVPTSMSARVNL